MVKAPMSDLAALVSAISQVAATPAADPLARARDLAALVSAISQVAAMQPAADPLARARGLAEAADNGLVLTNDDLSSLLGQGVSSWRDGHLAFGYAFRRHQQGRQVLWQIARAITTTSRPALTAAVGTRNRKVGFSTPEVIEAQVRVLGDGAALFASNLIG
jgi:hypothetical protein